MLKAVLILFVLGSVSAQAVTLSCPESYVQGPSCTNTKMSLEGYEQPQVMVEKLILCKNLENGHFALVMDRAPMRDIPATLYADGQGFGRNGFELFTESNTSEKGVMYFPWQPPMTRIFVIDNTQMPTAVSEFTCKSK
jgi:hypothetical protein